MHAQGQEPAGTSRSQPRRVPVRAAGPPPMPVHPAMPMTPQAILHLQRTVGNAAVARLIEAQQRQPDSRGDDRGHNQPVQRSTVSDVLRSPGRPLDDDTRTEMEARLGADFSDVRLHTDTVAQDSAAEVGARAYTSGSHVVIGDGGADKHTLAHELTHVIQQRKGPVAGAENGSGLVVSDPSDRFERAAEENARRVMSGQPAQAHQGLSPGYGAAGQPAVQRVADEESEREQKTVLVNFGTRGIQVKVHCERKTPNAPWVVFLPSGTDPDQRAAIAEQLQAPEDTIKFTNARNDKVELADGSVREASEGAKVRQAAQLVVRYLRRVGIDSLDQTSVQQALQNVSVTFHGPNMWEWVVRQKAFGSAEAMEAITSGNPRGNRAVDINEDAYTLPAVVHELFHVLEHTSLSSLEGGLVEGITEYLTGLATGVDYRCSRDGSRTYRDEVRFVRDALRLGYVTTQQLQQAYFHGDTAALQKVNDFFTQFRKQQEATSFLFTGGR